MLYSRLSVALVTLVLATFYSHAGAEKLLRETYRSSSGLHKLIVVAEDNAALTRLASEGTIHRSIDYGGFRLLIVDDLTTDLLADPLFRRVSVRDMYDLIGLNGREFDTRVGEPSDLPETQTLEPASSEWQLYIVQFVGPAPPLVPWTPG